MRVLQTIFALIVLAFGSGVASDQAVAESIQQRHGLMWNRSGLPLVFPLQVKTLPGQDYFMVLVEAESEREMLAAFIEGGTFFRVLTPPGTFRIWFAHGRDWQGEEKLFGPGSDTGVMSVPELLVFGTLGRSRKAGHLIDLTQGALEDDSAIIVEVRLRCQGLRLTQAPRPISPTEEDTLFATRLTDEGELVQHPKAGFDPVRDTRTEEEARRIGPGPIFSEPRFDIRDVPC
jgi:hypothetical protein